MRRRHSRCEKTRSWCLVLALAFVCGNAAQAQDGAGEAEPQSGQAPPKLTIGDWFSPRYRGVDNTQGNQVVVRGYIPWVLGDIDQLARISMPITTTSPGKGGEGDDIDDFPSGPTGLGDTEIYDVAQISLSGIQIKLGPTFLLPTGTRSGVGSGRLTIGPAGGLNTRQGRWTFGTFSQSYFSVAGHSGFPTTSKTKIQPIINRTLSDGWEIGTSDMNFTYDWRSGHFSNLPFGMELGKNVIFVSREIKLVGQTEYNFANTPHASAWTFRFTLEVPLPELN